MKKKKYIIASTSYDERYGGVMVLHHICHLLNELGEEAYMCAIENYAPYFERRGGYWSTLLYRVRHLYTTVRKFRWWYYLAKQFKVNPSWNTPVLNPWCLLFNVGLDDYIVMYAEIVDGNPLGALHVSRLLMHNPGHFSGRINYGNDELIFRFSNSFARDFVPPVGSKLSDKLITVSATPTCFSTEGIPEQRKGIAYCVRKGKGKTMVHDMSNATIIDEKPLEEVAEILKRSEMFVSYDPITAFSRFALLCHCPSIIILGEGETKETFRPDPLMNSHFAYSIEEGQVKNWEDHYKWAEEHLAKQKQNSINNLKIYIAETQRYFAG